MCVFLRLRHVHIHQTLQPLPEREGLRLQTDGFRFCSGQKRVRFLIPRDSTLLHHYFSIIDFNILKKQKRFVHVFRTTARTLSFLLAVHINQNYAHPTGVPFMCGMDLATSSLGLGQVHDFNVCTECTDEYRVGYYSCSQRGQLNLAGRHNVPLATSAGTEKYKRTPE